MIFLKFSTQTHTQTHTHSSDMLNRLVLRNTWKLDVDPTMYCRFISWSRSRCAQCLEGRKYHHHTPMAVLFRPWGSIQAFRLLTGGLFRSGFGKWRWSAKNSLVTWCKSVRTYCTFQKWMCLFTCDACSVQISSFISQMLVDHVRLINQCLKLAPLDCVSILRFCIISWD